MFKSLNTLHHAYLLVGSRAEAEEKLHAFFKDEGMALTGSPDFFVWKGQTFGVDDARNLSESAVRKAFTARKIFLITPEKITLEAQNALLKTFEDPIPDTHFFLVLRDAELVIPTLRSRMQVLRVGEETDSSEARKFLGQSPKDRMAFVKKFVDQERNPSPFLDELLMLERNRDVYKMRLVSDDRAASARLILEHLAMVL